MKTIITVIVMTFAVITTANADAEAHLFKAEELEVQAEVLEADAKHLAKVLREIKAGEEQRKENLRVTELFLKYGDGNKEKDRNLYNSALESLREAHARMERTKDDIHRARTEARRLRAQAAIHRRKAGGEQ